MGRGGELYMLDMGEPVKIVDLARDMIRLCVLQEGVDIDIQFTGTRPGEKLYEEMFFNDEIATNTEHPKILRARANRSGSSSDIEIAQLLDAALEGAHSDKLRAMLKQLVPDFFGGTPAAGITSIPDQPPKRRGRPSGEMSRV